MEQDFQPSTPVINPLSQPLSPRSQEIQGVLADPAAFLDAHYTEVNNLRASVHALSQTQQSQSIAPSSSSTNTPPSSTASAVDPQTLATIVAAVAAALPRNPDIRNPKSEKLPDIDKYDGDVEKLDAWEQALKQKMYGNADRYPTDKAKITYAESRLTITKKAHNLMNRYRVNGICTLISFEDWCRKLREVCGNRFEEEDARIYLRDTLKQGSMSFDEYFNLFIQKKERSGMEDASLIDAMKTNVNYSTQAAAIAWRKADGSLPTTFQDHVDMWSTVDWHLRQIKHRHPRAANAATSSTSARRPQAATSSSTAKPVASSSSSSAPGPVSSMPATPVVSMPPGDPMDLSQALAAVKGKSLKIPKVKEICNTWNLCYYCKLFHPGKTAIDCPNKGNKTAHARAMVLYEPPPSESSAPPPPAITEAENA